VYRWLSNSSGSSILFGKGIRAFKLVPGFSGCFLGGKAPLAGDLSVHLGRRVCENGTFSPFSPLFPGLGEKSGLLLGDDFCFDIIIKQVLRVRSYHILAEAYDSKARSDK